MLGLPAELGAAAATIVGFEGGSRGVEEGVAAGGEEGLQVIQRRGIEALR